MSSLSSIATFVLLQLNWAILVYLVLVNGFYLLLLLSSSRELARRLREMRRETRHRVLSCELAPRISVLVPAYNEASSIAQSLQALATLDYPNLEIVVVDDGSSDETLNVLLAAFELRPVALCGGTAPPDQSGAGDVSLSTVSWSRGGLQGQRGQGRRAERGAVYGDR